MKRNPGMGILAGMDIPTANCRHLNGCQGNMKYKFTWVWCGSNREGSRSPAILQPVFRPRPVRLPSLQHGQQPRHEPTLPPERSRQHRPRHGCQDHRIRAGLRQPPNRLVTFSAIDDEAPTQGWLPGRHYFRAKPDWFACFCHP